MEGNPVGNQNPTQANGMFGADSDDLRLLWPKRLMDELATKRRHHEWSTPLAIINFILATLLGLAIGPTQLVMLVLTQNYTLVTESYYPVILRIAILISSLLAISTIISMIRAWKEQPKRSLMTAILGVNTAAVVLLVWIAAFLVDFQPNQIAFAMVLIIAAGWALAIVTAKQFFSAEKSQRPILIILISALILGIVETIFATVYIFSQTNSAKEEQLAIENLGKAQAAAQINGITSRLSDLVYTICSGTYDPIYIPPNRNDTGLFECRDSHEVYSVSGPNKPVSDTTSVSTGAAFYFGVTKNDQISQYFPIESGAKYLYRDLKEDENPTELVMLLVASTEEVLVNAYLDQLTELINAETAENTLNLSLFYNAEFNTVNSTKDFILVAAADTIALTDYLPHGTNRRGYLNGKYGTYIYTPDLTMPALKELGLSPLLYSSQVREAINSHRHITLSLESGHTYTTDELRDLFYANFVDPISE